MTNLAMIFAIVIAGVSIFWIVVGLILHSIMNDSKYDDEIRALNKEEYREIKEKAAEINRWAANLIKQPKEKHYKLSDIQSLKENIETLELTTAQHRFMFLFNQLTKTEQNKFKKNNPVGKLRDDYLGREWYTKEEKKDYENQTWNDVLDFELGEEKIYIHLIRKLEEFKKAKEIYKNYNGGNK